MGFENTIIYLIGYPGTGKYTIGKEICRIATEFRLVDNHLINNPLFSIIQADGITPLPPRIWENVGKMYDIVLDTMIHISPPHYSFVMTNALFETEAEHKWFKSIENMANQRQAKFVPVLLTVSLEEHQKRIGAEDRRLRLKEIDPAAPLRYHTADSLIKLSHPSLLKLDVSSYPPAESAALIFDHVNTIAK